MGLGEGAERRGDAAANLVVPVLAAVGFRGIVGVGVGLAPVQPHPGIGEGIVDVLMQAHPLDAGLQGMLPGEVGIIVEVQVGGCAVTDILVRDVAVRGLGIVDPAAGPDEVRRDFRILGVGLTELPQGSGGLHALVVVVGEEEAPAGADKQIVARGVVHGRAGAPVREIESEIGPGRRRVPGAVGCGQVPQVFPEVVEEARR